MAKNFLEMAQGFPVQEEGNQQEEIIREIENLRKRVEKLESQIDQLSGPLTQMVVDVRTMLSEIENPFNYLSQMGFSDLIKSLRSKNGEQKIILKQEETQPKQKERKKTEEKEKAENKVAEPIVPPKREPLKNTRSLLKHKEDRFIKDETCLDSINVMNLLACTGFLLELFGRDRLRDELNFYEQEGWIDMETKEAILAAEKVLISSDELEVNNKRRPHVKKLGVGDHVTALYLINKLTRDDPVALLTFFFVLKKLSKIS